MIRYALACAGGHAFEAWFASSADYDEQAAQGLVECPFCASREVRKQIMAPAVTGVRRRGRETEPSPLAALAAEAAARLRAHVEAHFEDVGDAFAREARAIHAGESEARGIYGRASAEEVRELVAEGAPVAPLPAALAPRRPKAMN